MIKKGQIWISAILYILIITAVMVLVLNAGVPILKDLQDKTVFTRAKNTFLSLNQHITDISEEGVGSQRVVPIEIEKGALAVEDGALKWKLRTDAKILESGSEIALGNLYITANADVIAQKYSDYYILENSYIKAKLYRCEDRNSCVFNQSYVLMDLNFTDPDTGTQYQAAGSFSIGFGLGSWSYSGYSSLEDQGSNLGEASAVYYINNTNSSVYSILELTLGSNSDFIQARLR